MTEIVRSLESTVERNRRGGESWPDSPPLSVRLDFHKASPSWGPILGRVE